MRTVLLCCLLLMGCSGKQEPRPEESGDSQKKSKPALPKEQRKPDPKEGTGFSLTSTEKTLLWFAHVAAPALKRDGNELALERRRQQAQMELDKIKGQQVRWRIPVENISGRVDGKVHIGLDTRHKSLSEDAALGLRVFTSETKDHGFGLHSSFVVDRKKWMEEVAKGQSVLVEGIVDRVSFRLLTPIDGVARTTLFLEVFLRDWKLSRP